MFWTGTALVQQMSFNHKSTYSWHEKQLVECLLCLLEEHSTFLHQLLLFSCLLFKTIYIVSYSPQSKPFHLVLFDTIKATYSKAENAWCCYGNKVQCKPCVLVFDTPTELTQTQMNPFVHRFNQSLYDLFTCSITVFLHKTEDSEAWQQNKKPSTHSATNIVGIL